jgi:hypothetical protein
MRSLLAVVIACVALWRGAPAAAQGSDEARAAFQEGLDAFGEGRYPAARAAFARAYALSPSWKLLYNLGQCEAALKEYGLSLTHFERYLSEGGDNVNAERRDEVLAEVERLRKMVGSLEVTAPAGAVVLVDGIERGTAPLPGRIRVAASVEHELVVRKGARVLLERTVLIGGGEHLTFEATADAAAGQADEPPPAPEPEQPEARSGVATAGWVVLGAGAALLAGGGITARGLRLRQAGGHRQARCPGADLQRAPRRGRGRGRGRRAAAHRVQRRGRGGRDRRRARSGRRPGRRGPDGELEVLA